MIGVTKDEGYDMVCPAVKVTVRVRVRSKGRFSVS